MPKFIITWGIGFGTSAEVVEASSQEEAQTLAYQQAREEFENSAEYAANEYSDDLASEYDLD